MLCDGACSSDGPGAVLPGLEAVHAKNKTTNPAPDMAADTLLVRLRVLGGSGGGGGSPALVRLVRFLDGWSSAAPAVVGLVSEDTILRLREDGGGAGGITASLEEVEGAILSLAEERVTLGDMRKWTEEAGVSRKGIKT